VLPSQEPLTSEELNPISKTSPLFQRALEMNLLGTVEDAKLVAPRGFILSQWPNRFAAERALDLLGDQSRLTYQKGIPGTWDKNIDVKEWSTDIDTVYF
jgi:hypothetical protein